jgi:hypothetical protein
LPDHPVEIHVVHQVDVAAFGEKGAETDVRPVYG